MNDIFIVPLTNSERVCIIDTEDSPKVMQHKWRLQSGGKGYVATGSTSNFTSKMLHHFILPKSDTRFVDHRNRHTLDNTRRNLRYVSYHLNRHNAARQGGSSNFRGVYWRKDAKKWRAIFIFKSKNFSLGSFDSEIEAAKAYNRAALYYYGTNAVLNEV